MKALYTLSCLLTASFISTAQTGSVGIGTSTPDASTALDVRGAGKGVLIPSMTAAQRASILQPANGLLVFQNDGSSGFYWNAGTAATPSWQLLGAPQQEVYEVYGSGTLVVGSSTSTYTLIPGLTQTINIPANCKVHVHTDGGAQSTGATSTTYSVADIGIFVDGVVSTSGGQRRLAIANTTALVQLIANWSMDRTYTLAPGSHTFEVKAIGGIPGSSNLNVSSSAAPQLQGVLRVTVIRQ